jgi:formamidopyrimidine-DNA glycosylase
VPELPEVETVVRQVGVVLPGKVIKEFQGGDMDVVGKRIGQVSRKQKIIVMELETSEVVLVHLKMTGQLIFMGNNHERLVGGHPTADWVGELPSKHTRVVITFSDGSKLFFNDQRKFGWMRLVDSGQWSVIREKMPPDVVDEGFTVEYLTKVLSRSGRAVKLVILDQDKIGGMGNIYANDALNMANINPKNPANQLKTDAVKRLYAAMKTVIEKGIELGGASYSHFVGIEGVGGQYQNHFLVYGREGEKCRQCGGEIKKLILGGRGTYYCSGCQR